MICAKGLQIIKDSEGLRLNAYLCPAGVWTIGYGHTGPEVTPGMAITVDQAESYLLRDITVAEVAVRNRVKGLPEEATAALVSFVFNLGVGAFTGSTLLRLIRRGEFWLAADQFDRWIYCAGRKSQGLVTRRRREKQLFLSGWAEEIEAVA